MGFETFGESDVGEADTPPGEKTTGGGKVGEVSEDSTGGLSERHVGETGKEGTEDEGDVWKTFSGGSGKDLWGLSSKSKTVQGSGGSVKIRRSGGPGRSQETSVDDGWKDWNTGVLDRNDERRFGGTRVEVETWSVGWDNDTDDESTTEVEDEDSDKDSLDCSGDVSSRVLGFTSGNGDNLGTNVREGGLGEDGPETEESTETAGDTRVLGEWTWVLPVLETDLLTVGSTTSRDDDTENDQTDNGQDLDGSEPEFGLSISSSTQEVDGDDDE